MRLCEKEVDKMNEDPKLECLKFTVERDIGYFCRYDDLTGSIDNNQNSKQLLAIADSCYIPREKVFLPPRR